MSNERLAMVKRAWGCLSGGKASVPFETLVSKYNAPAHPRVTSREKKAETVMSDFVTLMGEKAQNGCVSEEGFCAYYAECNAVLPPDRDNYFCEIISKTWGVQGGADNVSAGRLADIEDCIFEKIRQRTHGADDEGKTMRKVFKHFDLDGFGTLCFGEFKNALETIGCLYKDLSLIHI